MDKTEALGILGTKTDTARLLAAYVTGAATWDETLAGLRDVIPAYGTMEKPPAPRLDTPEYGQWWQDVEDGPEGYDPAVHTEEGDLMTAEVLGLLTDEEGLSALTALRENTPVAETTQ